jgi:hypothetical protein
MRLAPTLSTTDTAVSLGSGWLLRMRMWFATLPMGRTMPAPAPPEAVPAATTQSKSATVLAFPIRGDALLVKLAEILKARISEKPEQSHRFRLSLVRAPRLRLVIDEAAHIEFDVVRSAFTMVVDVEYGTELTLDTAEFDTLVRFVVQYVRDKLTEASIQPEDAA